MDENAAGPRRPELPPGALPEPELTADEEEEADAEEVEAVGVPHPFVQAIEVVAEKVDPLLKLLKEIMEHSRAQQATITRYRFHMTWAALGVVLVVVGATAWLTYAGKVDGSTFGFLLGLVVGYVLTFIRDTIRPPTDRTQ